MDIQHELLQINNRIKRLIALVRRTEIAIIKGRFSNLKFDEIIEIGTTAKDAHKHTVISTIIFYKLKEIKDDTELEQIINNAKSDIEDSFETFLSVIDKYTTLDSIECRVSDKEVDDYQKEILETRLP